MENFGFDFLLLGAAFVMMAAVCAFEGWTQ